MARPLIKPLLFILIGLISSCDTDKAVISGITREVYRYQAFDSLGSLVVTGKIILTERTQDKIEGNWEFRNVSGRVDVGPQIGKGNFMGTVQDSIIYINLNPNLKIIM